MGQHVQLCIIVWNIQTQLTHLQLYCQVQPGASYACSLLHIELS
jgi:hypothetical protein